ncbi:YqgE/AlgH family protein [Thalassotalea agarivorans]|uniref:UPF0301 protein SAMN05660429_02798 n=1 Tax=Thalassotalea agarivorans TaxID=349064 RepID=A0A1I0HIN2_THASX|nr:YqgE/AlgH family protein [Thalassotalea agarivorans]SET82883.1 putative transcriptional regulator [Thalassotalea agarivorans]
MDSLENHLLIAMPSLDDSFFHKTVTYICEHNEEGAMGLIINLPLNLTVNDLLNHINQEDKHLATREQQVLTGGPVAQDRGFVLHSPQPGWRSSLSLSRDIMITTSKDILDALGTEQAPNDFIVTLGYAGWSAGQLEQELQENAWLTIPASTEILFQTPVPQRWQKATELLGIDVGHLSNDIGHA